MTGRPLRSVDGATDRVVVVGAGLSGLAAALYLLGAGRDVTVLQRSDHPGGRVGVFRGPDYEIDNGATVLTMPELIDQALAAVGSDVDAVDTPRTWHERGMLAGSPFSAAHVFRQTGPFRPRNFPRATDNVVLAGCGTTPGVGVPTALLSGKLAAMRIIGSR